MEIAYKDLVLIKEALESKVKILRYDPQREQKKYSEYVRLLDNINILILKQ